MWFVVRTTSGKEESAKEALLAKVPIVSEVYLPKKMTSYRNKQGRLLYHPQPLVSGYLFVNLNVWLNPKKEIESEYDFNQRVWNQLKKNVSHRGYFFYKANDAGDILPVVHGTRLLSENPENTFPSDFIKKSFIRDKDMTPFLRFNGGTEFINEEIQIIGESFEKVARANDIVRIVTGPMAGATGVVVSKKQTSKGKNFKDRHLEVRLGNSLCVSYSNIRRFDMVIVREAQEGEKSREPRLWYEIDHFIGLLQSKGHVDDAVTFLRKTLTWLHNKQKESLKDTIAKIEKTVEGEDDQRRLLKLVNDIPFKSGSAKETLDLYLYDCPIRPFITPSEEENRSEEIIKVQHEKFKEYIIPINLKDEFFQNVLEPDEEYLSGSYDYNAHVAIFTKGDFAGHAIVSWGRFYDEYASLFEDKRQAFIEDLKKKNYLKIHALLDSGHQLNNPKSPKITFCKGGGIGGFSLVVRGKQEEAAKELVRIVAPAAVEFWQKERLRNWRKLIQQYVLIHKIPPTLN